MKIRKLAGLKPVALAAMGIVLGRGAHADTVITFDALPSGQSSNARVLDGFGSNVTGSSAGIAVTGSATPNIGLAWGFTAIAGGGGGGGNNVEWDFYVGGVWAGAQLNNSAAGNAHTLTFTPTA